MVDKASVVTFTALINLVALLSFGLHDVHAFEAFCDETCKLADCDAAFEGLQGGRSANENSMIAATEAFFQSWKTYTTCHETVVASILCAKDLNRRHG